MLGLLVCTAVDLFARGPAAPLLRAAARRLGPGGAAGRALAAAAGARGGGPADAAMFALALAALFAARHPLAHVAVLAAAAAAGQVVFRGPV